MKTLTKRARKISEIPSSLRPLEIAIKVPRQPKCTVVNCFTDKAIFAYRDADFDNWLPETLSASAGVSVKGYELTETTTEAALIKVGRPFTNLLQIEDLILRTEKGEQACIVNGDANLFFLQVGNSVFAVRAPRSSEGWHVYLDRFDTGHEWNAGRRFFSLAT